MQQIEIVNLTRAEVSELVTNIVSDQIDRLKESFQPKNLPDFVTRDYVANEILHCDLSTVHNLTTRGILTKYGIGGRVYYKLDEVLEAIQIIN